MTTAIVLKGYPRLSETFIAQEILALQQAGLDLSIVSLRHPTDSATHPVHRRIDAPINYLPEYLWREPVRVLRSWWRVRKLETYAEARRAWRRDLARDLTPNRIRRWGQALVLAAELGPEVDRLYAHFLHTPSSVARYASILRNIPWSASAHAVDIWTTPEWELREKLASADWVLTCTKANREYLSPLAPDPDRVSLAYHGVDLDRFPAGTGKENSRHAPNPETPIRILSVGRLVPKKGYADLITALAKLPREPAWRFEHIGGGPEKKRLRRLAAGLGIGDRIDWRGAQPQDVVAEAYRTSDIFALTCVVAPDGDRDGLPNVLMEAQSQGLPVVATNVSAIPELILDGETGLLAEPGDTAVIAAHLELLIRDADRRAAIGAAGSARIRRYFVFSDCVGSVVERFGLQARPSVSRVA